MIDFETELKKFHPSLEVEQTEEAVANHDLADMIDLIVKTVKKENYLINMEVRKNIEKKYIKKDNKHMKMKILMPMIFLICFLVI